MITGDTPLTACHAAKQVHIVDRPVLILDSYRSASLTCLHPSATALPCITVIDPQVPLSQCTSATLTSACLPGLLAPPGA